VSVGGVINNTSAIAAKPITLKYPWVLWADRFRCAANWCGVGIVVLFVAGGEITSGAWHGLLGLGGVFVGGVIIILSPTRDSALGGALGAVLADRTVC